MKEKIYKFEDYQYKYLEKLIKWYASESPIHKIKVSWLSGMMKEQFYDGHQRKMLNRMVKKYNDRNR